MLASLSIPTLATLPTLPLPFLSLLPLILSILLNLMLPSPRVKQIAALTNPTPFGQAIINVDNTAGVEHMTAKDDRISLVFQSLFFTHTHRRSGAMQGKLREEIDSRRSQLLLLLLTLELNQRRKD